MTGEWTKNSLTSIAPPLVHQRHSLIKPHLLNLSGSDYHIDGVIVERNLEQANTDLDSATVKVEKHFIVLHARNPANLEWTINGRHKEALFSEGDAIINPADLFVAPHWDAEVEIFLMAIDPTIVNNIATKMDCSNKIELIPRFQFQDPLLEQLVRTLSAEFESHLPPDGIYVESLTHTLIVHLISKYSVSQLKPPMVSHRLSSRKLTLIKDYINDHLEETLSLDAIANIVNLSPSHFLRLFKKSTGLAPHQYVILKRIEKAKILLCQTKMSIAEIACQTGFADQSHLTRLMRRHTGLTPKILRDK